MKSLQSRLHAILMMCLMTASGLQAQEAPMPPSLSVATPYDAVYTHLYYLQPGSFRPAFSATALHPDFGRDSVHRVRTAVRLKQVLDGKGLFVHMGELPKIRDYVDSSSQRSTFTLFPVELPAIYLEQVEGNWYYALQSLEQVKSLHEATYPFGSDVLINLFGPWGHKTLFGLAIWQYLGLLITFFSLLVIYMLLRLIIRPFIKRILREYITGDSGRLMKYVQRITSILTVIVVLQLALWIVPTLLLPIQTGMVFDRILRLIHAVAIAILLARLVDLFTYYLSQLVTKTTNRLDDQAVPLIRNVFKGFVWIGAIFHILRLFDVDITALVAGVSIGSLAIALAAQDAVKHLIGSVVIFVDRPFHVGDYVIGSGFEGEIVEVGFRTTRIKTLDTSIIAVPNGNITNMSIQNLGARALRLFNTTIGLTYDSSPDQIKSFMAALKDVIHTHPQVQVDGHHVVLRELADSSINVLFRAYLDVPTYAEELKLKEHLIFTIMELAKSHGLDFAFPSQSVYINDQTTKEADEGKF